ncbi:MAG: hypothetical protein ACRCXX_12755 [Cetobacterium sp.]|uniref:hypothetical protein n=1 Tax=Cetobacterium sp. TaxID=2071632 RepID=UPI003F38F04A
MFGDLEITLDELKEMVGKPINGINMTPMSMISGTLIAMTKPDDNESIPGTLMIQTSKDFEPSEELVASGGVYTIKGFFDEYLGYGNLDEHMQSKGEVKILVTTDDISIDMLITKDNIEDTKVIVMPFSNALSVESEIPV